MEFIPGIPTQGRFILSAGRATSAPIKTRKLISLPHALAKHAWLGPASMEDVFLATVQAVLAGEYTADIKPTHNGQYMATLGTGQRYLLNADMLASITRALSSRFPIAGRGERATAFAKLAQDPGLTISIIGADLL